MWVVMCMIRLKISASSQIAGNASPIKKAHLVILKSTMLVFQVCIKVTIINFTVTKSGLEDQLLR